MRATILFCILAGAMSAQDFHGVSIGGTATAPTIINHSQQTIIGYVIQRNTNTGVSHIFDIFDSSRIVMDRTIKPGQELPVGGLSLGKASGSIDPVTKQWVEEGESTGYQLNGILFENGAFIARKAVTKQEQFEDEGSFQNIVANVYFVRSYARDMQYRERGERENALIGHGQATLHPGMDISVQHNKTLANVFLGVKRAEGVEAMEKAIAKLAALPDVVKGN